MKKASLFISVLAISILFLASFALAATSKVIPLQGKLTQPNGLTYNGQYSMTFKIYNVATSGTSLYTETISNVPVSAGLFSVILGESTPIPLAFDQDYYIEISIGSETLSPRQRLLSSPYAITAQNVAGGSVNATSGTFSNNVGIGTSTPTARLDVNGDIKASSLSSTSVSGDTITGRNVVGTNSLSAPQICIGSDCKLSWPTISQDPQFNSISISKNISINGNITTSANVGIGTQTPLYSLDVNGTSRFSQQLRAESGALVQGGALWVSPPNFIYTNTINAADSSGLKIADNTNSGGLFIKGNSGNVGIGTTNPSEKLDVVGNVKATGVCIGSDCRTSWPAAISGDVQFNSITASSDITSAGNVKAAGNIAVGLLAPSISSVSASATSQGLLNTAASYCYQVTATGLGGETKPSTQVCTTTGAGQNTINITWTPVTFATSYKIYGRVNNAIGFLATASTTAFTDVGSISPGSAPNPSSTTGTLTTTGSATFGGNVGIGTASPTQTLDVNGNIVVRGGGIYSNQPSTWFLTNTGSALPIKSGSLAITDNYVENATTNGLYVKGNVGIGTTSPQGKLDVNTSTILYGPDITKIGNVISGGILQAGYPAVNAFDKNEVTLLSTTSSTSSYIGQDFGAYPKNIRKVRIFRGAVGSYGFNAKLQYSNDNITWSDTNVNVTKLLNSVWTEKYVNDYGAHRYWRFLDIGGSSYFQTEEIEMMEASNSALIVKDDGNVTVNGKLNWVSRPWFVAAGDSTQSSAWVGGAAATWTKVNLNQKTGTASSSYNPITGDFTAPETGAYYCFAKLFHTISVAPDTSYIISTCTDLSGNDYVCNNFYTWDYENLISTNSATSDLINHGIFSLQKGEKLYWRAYTSSGDAYLYYPPYSRMGCFEL